MDYYAYLSKWSGGCKRAKYADDETPITAAWQAAKKQPLPRETRVPRGVEPMVPPMQLLVPLCYHLQVAGGTKPFFLGSRDAGRLLGVPHTTVLCWLEILADEDGPFRILRKVSIGSHAARRTNEWEYRRLTSVCRAARA